MICPERGKDVKWFYDHMCESHGWALAEAEKYADDQYLEESMKNEE